MLDDSVTIGERKDPRETSVAFLIAFSSSRDFTAMEVSLYAGTLVSRERRLLRKEHQTVGERVRGSLELRNSSE